MQQEDTKRGYWCWCKHPQGRQTTTVMGRVVGLSQHDQRHITGEEWLNDHYCFSGANQLQLPHLSGLQDVSDSQLNWGSWVYPSPPQVVVTGWQFSLLVAPRERKTFWQPSNLWSQVTDCSTNGHSSQVHKPEEKYCHFILRKVVYFFVQVDWHGDPERNSDMVIQNGTVTVECLLWYQPPH